MFDKETKKNMPTNNIQSFIFHFIIEIRTQNKCSCFLTAAKYAKPLSICLSRIRIITHSYRIRFYLNFRVNVPGKVGLSGGVALPWLCFFGALLNGCNLRCGRGDGWSIFTALIIWFGMSRTDNFADSLCGWFHSVGEKIKKIIFSFF